MRIGNHALEELARKVSRQGVSIEITGAGHLRWMLPDGSSFVTANSTKSARVVIKARLRLRRAGIEL